MPLGLPGYIDIRKILVTTNLRSRRSSFLAWSAILHTAPTIFFTCEILPPETYNAIHQREHSSTLLSRTTTIQVSARSNSGSTVICTRISFLARVTKFESLPRQQVRYFHQHRPV